MNLKCIFYCTLSPQDTPQPPLRINTCLRNPVANRTDKVSQCNQLEIHFSFKTSSRGKSHFNLRLQPPEVKIIFLCKLLVKL